MDRVYLPQWNPIIKKITARVVHLSKNQITGNATSDPHPLDLTIKTVFNTSPTLPAKNGDHGMTKAELIKRLADDNPTLYLRDVERVVDTVFGEITNALANGDRVEIRGFGAFSTRARSARTGRNPRTGAAVEVSEKSMPHFKTGKQLRDR